MLDKLEEGGKILVEVVKLLKVVFEKINFWFK